MKPTKKTIAKLNNSTTVQSGVTFGPITATPTPPPKPKPK